MLVSALLAITSLTLDITLPALPGLASALGGDAGRVQLVVALYLLGLAAGQLAYGPASDRFGRRPVLLVGLVLYLLATLVCAVTWSLDWLVVGRLLQGFGACAGPVIARAVVRDVYEPAPGARVLSVAAMGMSLAPIVAALVGGVIVHVLHWRGVFVFLAGLGGVLLLATAATLPETNPAARWSEGARPGLARNYRAVLAERRFVGHVLTLTGGSIGLFAWLSGSPFVLMTLLGLPPAVYGLAFAVVSLGQLGGASISTRLVVRLGIERTVAVGLGLYVVGAALLVAIVAAGALHPATVVVPMVVFQLGNGMVMPNTFAGAIAPFPRAAGAASALAGFSQMIAGAVSGVILGRLHDGSARPLAGLLLGGAVLASAAFWLVAWPARRAGRGGA